MRHRQRGTAMIEAALGLALFTPVLFAALRLAYGANQMHELANGVTAAARAAGACASEDEIRRAAMGEIAGLEPRNVKIVIDRASDPAKVRVSIENVRVMRLSGPEPLGQAPAATFPYSCE